MIFMGIPISKRMIKEMCMRMSITTMRMMKIWMILNLRRFSERKEEGMVIMVLIRNHDLVVSISNREFCN